MTLIEEPPMSGSSGDDERDAPDSEEHARADTTIDLTDDHDADEAPAETAEDTAVDDERPLAPDASAHGGRKIDPSGRITYRGMRIRRVRLKSVAKISFVFWLLAFAVAIGTTVVLWNIARALGLVETFEETMITSLGLETFEIDGGGIFGVVLGGTALLCLLGWLGTIAMAAVYNAACGVLGGLAVETGPLKRRRRVFSWRHRGFVTVSE